MSTLGAEFGSRRNGLNAVRLGLALIVIVSHAWPLGLYRSTDPTIGTTTVGSVAVMAFFAISGYLITASRERTATGRYLWHRALRILPGYWVCLAVIGFVVAPLAWVRDHDLGAYPWGDAAKYVLLNLGLYTNTYPTIAGTQTGMPVELQYWNGAAWSLFFEFLCYLGIALLAATRLLRPQIVAACFAAGTLLLLAWELFPTPMTEVLFHSHNAYRLVTTGTVFLAGATVYLYRDRVPFRDDLAAGCAVVTAAGLLLLAHPQWLIALPVAYLMLWIGLRTPSGGILGHTDISYGTYIYAYPVAVLLTLWGADRLPVGVYLTLTVAIVVPLAGASWYLVEKPAMARKNAVLAFRKRPRALIPPTAPNAEPVPTTFPGAASNADRAAVLEAS